MIKIITDSTCALSPEFLAERAIGMVHLKVNFGETESYDELSGISNAEFYRRLLTENVFPSTSQPAAGEFKAEYERIAEPGDEILVLTLSGKLSGTYGSAVMASKMVPDIPVTVFDSLSVGLGLGLMVATASDMALAGASMAEILARLEQMRRDVRIYFIVDTLEYLHKGGRIGGAAAFFGGILNIKPILTFIDGKIEAIDKVRSKRKALTRIFDLLDQNFPDKSQSVQIGVMHAAAESELPAMEEKLLSLFPNHTRVITGEISPVLGAHGGPGLLGAGVIPNPPTE